MTEIDPAINAAAVIAGCNHFDFHLKCTYPNCACEAFPASVLAALRLARSPDAGQTGAVLKAYML